MSILSFEFEDTHNPWRVEKFSLNAVNLLVGLSGVGKTRVLRALSAVVGAVRDGKARSEPKGCKWQIELKGVDGQVYYWEAETEQPDEDDVEDIFSATETDEYKDNKLLFIYEKVRTVQGTVIASREKEQIYLNGSPAPQLTNQESIISLFKKEKTIAPVHAALSAIRYSHADKKFRLTPYDLSGLKSRSEGAVSLETLRAWPYPLHIRAWILKDRYPERWNDLVDEFAEMFPSVRDVLITSLAEIENRKPKTNDILMFGLKEAGVSTCIPEYFWSSGMLRTWLHLIETELFPAGSTILIDEYENSLGINCIQGLTKALLRRASDLQLIITSHHPYVINHINMQDWHIVQREGSHVFVRPATAFPALNTKSRQEAFTILISSDQYLEHSIKP